MPKEINNEQIGSTEKVNMQPMVSILGSLTALGFETQFKATEQGLLSLTTRKTFQPGEITMVHFYRFEGESNPDDNAILYAIETNDGEKGTIVDAYGPYNDSQVTNCMRQVQIHTGDLTD